MNSGFTLGRIAGIRITVHWSVLVIFVLIAWGLASTQFPATYPEYSTAAHIAAALVTAVVFFFSLLAHELSHALVARRQGVHVEGITLWLFGGVARLSGEARDPAAEVRISGVGPLVSLVLGVLFLLVLGLLAAGGYDGIALAALAWLGGINIVLAVFNALPAAPLDGGRLLRALIWWRTGDRLKATVWAGRAGQALGWALIVIGLVTGLVLGDLGALWLALIGWFVIGVATMESRQAIIRDQLGHIPVRDLMTPLPVTAPASMTVAELLASDLIRQRHSTFPLTEDGRTPLGLVTFRQIRQVPPEARATTRLIDIACPLDRVAQVRPDEPASDMLPRLSECAEGRALVVDHGVLVGIVSPSDINRMLEWVALTRGPWHRV